MATDLNTLTNLVVALNLRVEAMEAAIAGLVAKQQYLATVTLLEESINTLQADVTALKATVDSHSTILEESE